MKTETILTRVHEVLNMPQETDPFTLRAMLSNLADDLAAQVRAECAASRGQGSAVRAVSGMLNDVKKRDPARRFLHYAWTDGEGRQCACDGYRAFRLTEALPLEERPEDAGAPMDLSRLFSNLRGYESMPLPSAQEVKAHIALERARYGRKYKYNAAAWDFGEFRPAVDAQYLLDLMAVLPDATEVFYNPSSVAAPLYAKGGRGEAIQLPCWTAKKKAEHAAMQRRTAAASLNMR